MDYDLMPAGHIARQTTFKLAKQVEELRAENAKLREALAMAREDLYYLGESDELLAPAIERVDAALAATK